VAATAALAAVAAAAPQADGTDDAVVPGGLLLLPNADRPPSRHRGRNATELEQRLLYAPRGADRDWLLKRPC